MPYKVFLSPTGSGNTIFEGDVINGYTSADGSDVVIKFYSNDRGYTAGAFGRTKDKKNQDSGTPINADGAKALRAELGELLEKHAGSVGVFKATSSQKHFTLTREVEGAPLILGVIGTDCPGHGESERTRDEKAYGAEMAEHVIRLMDKLKIEKAHIVGYSMGGMIAGKLVAKHPDRVKSVALCGMGWLQDGSFLQKSWDFLGKNDLGAVPAECTRNLGKLAITEDELLKIKVPVNVIVGDQDPCRALYVMPLEKVRKDWPVVLIKNAGHLDCVIKPEFRDEVKKWLDQQTKK